MRCIHLNIRSASFLILAVLLNRIKHTHMADNHIPFVIQDTTQNNENKIVYSLGETVLECPSDKNCSELNYPCIECDLPLHSNCRYGEELNVTCRPHQQVECSDRTPFNRSMLCRYCYQTDLWEHVCMPLANCNSVATPRQYYRTNCSVFNEVICLGNRIFPKRLQCNWTGGYRWSTALALSITLGGFGADRFYLGHWQEGIGKLFSFGGLGVWTLIDVILISLHYLGPADGSLYL